MSSYSALSDSRPEPSDAAVNAMLAATAGWSIDTSRLYLAGFSGTARAALAFAVALRGHVAGVIAAGGAVGFELGGPETAFAADQPSRPSVRPGRGTSITRRCWRWASGSGGRGGRTGS